jgi:hypothetical protein
VLLLTGATGLVGCALLARLTATGRPVRDPGTSSLLLLERMALLPVAAISGSGPAVFPPIWAPRRRISDVLDAI